MSLQLQLSAKRAFPAVMALVFLPWMMVVLITAGWWPALNLLGYAVLVFSVGYGIVALALPAPVGGQTIFFAPAVGLLTVSALTAFWLRMGLSLMSVAAPWCALAAAGLWCLWRDRGQWRKDTIAWGASFLLLSVLICTVYFLPGSRNDAVQRPDGSYNWIYVDTQYFHSMAASIKNADGPPKDPGSAATELFYHFGPYAPAAVISRLDGLNLGNAFARVTRGTSLWALLLSSFGLGIVLSRKTSAEKFGGLMSVAGLFFYGSLLSLFTDEANSASHVHGAILFRIPDVAVLADGGPFSHLILGHSMLHGMIAITATLGLCLALREQETVPAWREFIVILLPALAVPMSSVAALYCLGAAGVALFWDRLGVVRSWLFIALMIGCFLAAWKIMGYSHAPEALGVTFKSRFMWQWWTLALGFTAGLGLRILAFGWVSHRLNDVLSVLFLATVAGLMLFSILLELGNFDHADLDLYFNERYGIYFLQCLFSLFAFSRLSPDFWRANERSQWFSEWLRVARKGMVFLVSLGILIGIFAYAKHAHTGVSFFAFKIFLALVLLAVVSCTVALADSHPRRVTVASAVLMSLLLLGFLAWIPAWLNFGLGRMKMDITLSPGEVRGLNRLRELALPQERFATNQHAVSSLASAQERSFGYSALSERPVLLEGYYYHGVDTVLFFNGLHRDNDLLFTTNSPDKLYEIAKTWHVRWLVARPGTDIAVARPLPPWLVEEQDCGTLKIYRIGDQFLVR